MALTVPDNKYGITSNVNNISNTTLSEAGRLALNGTGLLTPDGKGIKPEYAAFIPEQGVTPSTMTTDQVKKFISCVVDSLLGDSMGRKGIFRPYC